jgi:hypothetical protein
MRLSEVQAVAQEAGRSTLDEFSQPKLQFINHLKIESIQFNENS